VYPRLDPEFLAAGLRVLSPELPYNPEAEGPVTVVISGDGALRGAEPGGGSYELTAIAWFSFESKAAMREEYPEVYNTDTYMPAAEYSVR